MGKDLCKAAKKGDLEKIKKLLAKEKIDDLDKDNYSPLHCAIIGEQLAACNLLLENGANVNLKTPIGDTPIILALKLAKTSEKQEDIVILLVNKNADLEIESKDRKSCERYLEVLPRRVLIRYKEALQLRLRNKQINTPTGKPSPMVRPTTPTSSITTSTTTTPNVTPVIGSNTTTTSTSTPFTINGLSSVTPPLTPSIVTTVPNQTVASNGTPVLRPPQLDIITPKALLGDDYVNVKDMRVIWLEVAYRTSVVALRSEKVRYDDITKAIDECGNILVHLLEIIGNPETSSFSELGRNQDSISSIQERVKNLREGISMRLFSRIDHSELMRLVAAFVGSLHWMYFCWSEVSQDDINRSIAECALSCRSAMNSVSTSTQLPIGLLSNICKLISNVSTKIYITRSPIDSKKLSDSLQSITSTFKSLMVLTQISNKTTTTQSPSLTKSPENIITLGRSIAEQLSQLKSSTGKLLPSRIGPSLELELERDSTETASKQLRSSLDYFRSRQVNSHPLPTLIKERLVSTIASIQQSINTYTNFSTQQKDLQIILPAQMIANDINELRTIIITDYITQQRQEQPVISEEFSEQLTNAINTLYNISTQLLFTVSAIVCHNRVADFSQIGFELSNISSCCCVILDSFCF